MRLLRALAAKIAAEMGLQRLGRRALREIRFRKYHIPPGHDVAARARLLRRLPGTWPTTVLPETTVS